MPDQIKIALCGAAGEIAEQHIRAISESSHFKLVAVCDKTIEKDPDAVFRRYPQFNLADVGMFSNFDDMLGLSKLDAVSIATPNFLHAPQSISGLHAGKEVLVEKPMATSFDEATAMINAAQMKERLLQVALHFQFSPEVEHFVHHRESFGVIHHFDFSCGGCFPKGRGWFLDRNQSGGGPLMDMGANALSALRCIIQADNFSIHSTHFRFQDPQSGQNIDVRDGVASGDRALESNAVERYAAVELSLGGIAGKATFDWERQVPYHAKTLLQTSKGLVTLDHAQHTLQVDDKDPVDFSDQRYPRIYQEFARGIETRESNARGAALDVGTIVEAYNYGKAV